MSWVRVLRGHLKEIVERLSLFCLGKCLGSPVNWHWVVGSSRATVMCQRSLLQTFYLTTPFMEIRNTLSSLAECILIIWKIGHFSLSGDCPVFIPKTINITVKLLKISDMKTIVNSYHQHNKSYLCNALIPCWLHDSWTLPHTRHPHCWNPHSRYRRDLSKQAKIRYASWVFFVLNLADSKNLIKFANNIKELSHVNKQYRYRNRAYK